MKRQIASSYTSRNVRRKTESASGLPASKASDSSPPASTPTSDTLAPDLESLTTHTQDSSVSAEDFESDEPSSEETSSLGSDSNSSSSGEDSNDEEDDAAQSSEFELSNNPTPRNGITQYADDSGITTLRAGRKPVMSSSKLPKGPATLLDKVRQFLPQLEAANSALEAAKAAGTLGEQSMEMEDDSDEETYIEMDLGLGVLEQQDSAGTDGREDSDGELGDDESSKEERDVMGKLLGRKKSRRAHVEEVRDA